MTFMVPHFYYIFFHFLLLLELNIAAGTIFSSTLRWCFLGKYHDLCVASKYDLQYSSL